MDITMMALNQRFREHFSTVESFTNVFVEETSLKVKYSERQRDLFSEHWPRLIKNKVPIQISAVAVPFDVTGREGFKMQRGAYIRMLYFWSVDDVGNKPREKNNTEAKKKALRVIRPEHVSSSLETQPPTPRGDVHAKYSYSKFDSEDEKEHPPTPRPSPDVKPSAKKSKKYVAVFNTDSEGEEEKVAPSDVRASNIAPPCDAMSDLDLDAEVPKKVAPKKRAKPASKAPKNFIE